jgi:aminopeptidase YwaD
MWDATYSSPPWITRAYSVTHLGSPLATNIRERFQVVSSLYRAPALTGAPGAPPTPVAATADADPMTHIASLASDALQGRDSPSAGLSAASAYVEQFARKYGLVGPNTKNAASAYQQPFQVFSFADGARQAAPGHAAHRDFGHTLFEEGFYLDEHMPADTRALLGGKYEEAMR